MKQIQKVKRLNHCRICGGTDLTEFLSLGSIPLPNGFLHKEDLGKDEPYFPLTVGFCSNCYLVQLLETVSPEMMFRNYVYIPSASQTRMDNFSQIAAQAKEMVALNEKSLVIDIGSNDGSLLSYFKGYGIRTLGIDPAVNLAKIAELKGIETINTYISPTVAKKIVKEFGHAQVITATNVVAHIDNLHELFSAVEIMISKTGVFISEFPYLGDLLEKKLFDTIYHEHLSYFSIHPLLKLIKQHGLKIVDLKRTPIDGGALRLSISPTASPYPEAITSIESLLRLEKKWKLDQLKTYVIFSNEVLDLKQNIQQALSRLKKQKYSIAGYGASARGNILLSFCGLGKETLDFIVDSTPYKQGLVTPGHHIPIYPEDALITTQPDYTLILAWNFVNEITQKQSEYSRRGGKFIIPVPKVEIVTTQSKQKKKPKVIVIMPAHNAAKTLFASYKKIPRDLVDEVILVDDASQDQTYDVAKRLPITVYRNRLNLGYGGNLKVCLTKALERKADIIIEYHPDDQYDPKDLNIFIQKAAQGYDFGLGSRFVTPSQALANKMPLVKFVANRAMSFIDQLILGIEMSEFHSGFRMYTRRLLEKVPFYQNSDDYLFSFEIIVQAVFWGMRVAEVPVSCRYHPSMHTANLKRSMIYALGTFKTLWQYTLAKFFHYQRGPFLLIKSAPCPLCEQKVTRFEYVVRDSVSNKQFSIFFCSLCRIGFTVPVPTNLGPFYPRNYYSTIKTWIYKLLQVRRPKIIHTYIPQGRLLDIGCGDGNLSQQLDAVLYNYTGIETPFAKSRNPLVKSVGIEGMREPKNSYKGVMFWESLEHLKNPLEALKKASMALAPKGFLIIECPDFSAWERYLFGAHWFHLDPPRHLFHYTPVGLCKILQDMGYKIIEQKRLYAPEYIPVGLAQSLLYRVSPNLNLFKRQGAYVSFFAILLLSSVSLVMIPISYIFYLLNGSPIQIIIAQKD